MRHYGSYHRTAQDAVKNQLFKAVVITAVEVSG
jgi:hypothetical protein